MSTTSLNGPDPELAARSCFMCLMRAKQRQYEDMKPELDKAWRDGKPDSNLVIFGWDPKYDKMLRPGPYRAVCGDAPSMGIVGPSYLAGGTEDGLCWDHVAGLPDPGAPQLDLTTQLPPGLMRRP